MTCANINSLQSHCDYCWPFYTRFPQSRTPVVRVKVNMKHSKGQNGVQQQDAGQLTLEACGSASIVAQYLPRFGLLLNRSSQPKTLGKMQRQKVSVGKRAASANPSLLPVSAHEQVGDYCLCMTLSLPHQGHGWSPETKGPLTSLSMTSSWKANFATRSARSAMSISLYMHFCDCIHNITGEFWSPLQVCTVRR